MRSYRALRWLSTARERSVLRIGTYEHGSSLVECALILPVFTLLLAGAVDFGRAWYVGLEIGAAAEAGALYGLGNVTDVPGMKAAALLDAPDLGSLQVSASYGSECSDGTAAVVFSTSVPVCAINVVSYVEVVTTGSYTPILRYPGFASVFNLSGKARMRTSN